MQGNQERKQACFMRWIARDEAVRTCSYDWLLQGRYTDCILSAEGLFVPCHQIVLASCSPYFDGLLSSNQSGEKPTLILAGVTSKDLLLALTFMYTGQIEVPVEQFSSFVSTVLYLQIKGIIHESTSPPARNLAVLTPTQYSYTCNDTGLSPPIFPTTVLEDYEQLRLNTDLTTLMVAAEEPNLANPQKNIDPLAEDNGYLHESIGESSDGLENVAPAELVDFHTPNPPQTQETPDRSMPVLYLGPEDTITQANENSTAARTRRQHKIPAHLQGFDLNNNGYVSKNRKKPRSEPVKGQKYGKRRRIQPEPSERPSEPKVEPQLAEASRAHVFQRVPPRLTVSSVEVLPKHHPQFIVDDNALFYENLSQ